jgi:hypothetical protein
MPAEVQAEARRRGLIPDLPGPEAKVNGGGRPADFRDSTLRLYARIITRKVLIACYITQQHIHLFDMRECTDGS